MFWLSLAILSPNIPDHCTPTTSFLVNVSSFFHTCVPTPLAFISTLLGVLSIVSWLFAQLPQIIKNHKLGSAAGLSIFFLIEWLLGDLTNSFGAVLTHQASWQIVVASYYVFVDVTLVGQYMWYSHIKQARKEKQESYKSGDNRRQDQDSSDVLVGILPVSSASSISNPRSEEGKKTTEADKKTTKDASDLPSRTRDVRNNSVWSSTFSFSGEKTSFNRTITRHQYSPTSLIPSPKTILLISMLLTVLAQASPLHSTPQTLDNASANPSELAGRILSWCSTVLYLGSRLPQIYKNYTRLSTAGLSPTLFVAAFFGNLFYSTSLLTNPLAWSSYPPHGLHGWVNKEGSDRAIWIALAAPFWLGAAGILALDAAVGVQFLMYGEAREEKAVVTRDERGRIHWKKVGGWMRGWVPSPSPGPARRVEEERLLGNSEGRQGNGERYGAVK